MNWPKTRYCPRAHCCFLMWLQRRLRALSPGRFIEIGPGSGEITRLLLDAGWSGTAYELAGSVGAGLRQRFAAALDGGRLTVMQGDYLATAPQRAADLIISCMVMEHLDEKHERMFMRISAENLRPGGRMIGIVPASPRHWGIEDDIAGHYRRYTRATLGRLASDSGWRLLDMAGLTYPLSNMLLPISNFLVRRREAAKLALPMIERTKLSGQRRVPFKTHFQSPFAFLLNEVTLMPFDFLQRLGRRSERALVLYFEAEPNH
jgi:SAM-dependent methyltransferase